MKELFQAAKIYSLLCSQNTSFVQKDNVKKKCYNNFWTYIIIIIMIIYSQSNLFFPVLIGVSNYLFYSGEFFPNRVVCMVIPVSLLPLNSYPLTSTTLAEPLSLSQSSICSAPSNEILLFWCRSHSVIFDLPHFYCNHDELKYSISL
jgi:hypothetical protein